MLVQGPGYSNMHSRLENSLNPIMQDATIQLQPCCNILAHASRLEMSTLHKDSSNLVINFMFATVQEPFLRYAAFILQLPKIRKPQSRPRWQPTPTLFVSRIVVRWEEKARSQL